MDAGSWFNDQFPDRARPSFQNLHILSLEEIIHIAESGHRQPGLYIETKNASLYPNIEHQLVDLLTSRGWIRSTLDPKTRVPLRNEQLQFAARVIFQSFDLESLRRLKALAPDVPRVLLINEIMMKENGWETLLIQASQVGIGIGTWGNGHKSSPNWATDESPTRYMTTWPWYTGQAHRAGLLVHPWTINDQWEMWMLYFCSADGFFTNRPELALATYRRQNSITLPSAWEVVGY